MARKWWLAVVLFAGCKNPLLGQWEGECAVKVGEEVRTHSLEIEIDNVEKKDLDGTGQLIEDRSGDGLDEKVHDGTLQGSRDKKHVSIIVTLGGDDLVLEGNRAGKTIKGDCEWGSNKGDFEVDRVD